MPLIPLLTNLGLLAACVALGYTASRRRASAIAALMGALAAGAAGGWVFFHPEWFVRVLPLADAIFYFNLFPYCAALAFFPALRFARTRAQTARLASLLGILFVLAVVPWRYFWLPPVELGEAHIDERGVVRQTSLDSCSAAAAATLLHLHGLEGTESRVAELACTRKDSGTQALGVYRALRRLTRESGYSVEVRSMTAAELTAHDGPLLIRVGLLGDQETETERQLANRYSWMPGVLHDVVYLGPVPDNPERVYIAEPSIGRETWRVRELEALFRGVAIELVED